MWHQYHLQLPPLPRGCHLITDQVVAAVERLTRVKCGLLHVFLLHTSASLTINESADPDVRADMAQFLDHLCPDSFPFEHTVEGPDDMPAHVKATLSGCSLTLPVSDGGLALGTWQGIWLCEHRNRGSARKLIITLHGEGSER